MSVNPFLGVGLHALGGFAAASFYIPYRRVKHWSWESYWLVGGFFSWIIAPWAIASITVPDLLVVLRQAPLKNVFWSWLFGVLWGIGGLTFGLAMRYLGMSLGYALALGFCAAFGTVIPPVFTGQYADLLHTASGWTVLAGVVVCLGGISVCGLAGVSKEHELSAEAKRTAIREFDFVKGVWVAVFAGLMSACMSFGIAAGEPIAELAMRHGAPQLWQNGPVFIVILAGGFVTNLIWCVLLNLRNGTGRDYVNAAAPLRLNYLFSACAGVIWYLQFMFYGMGTTQMGQYHFSSWSIHMAFIIVFSNLWGLFFHEWRGCSPRIHWLIRGGIGVLILSTVVIGGGNCLAAVSRQSPG